MKNRIRKLRKELDVTQQEFADRIGMKRNTVANYETGRNDPSASVISLICREFNVNEEWLRYGTGDMFVPAPKNNLRALAEEYNLTESDCILIEKYIAMKSDHRKAIENFILETAKMLKSSQNVFSVPDEDELDDLILDNNSTNKVG